MRAARLTLSRFMGNIAASIDWISGPFLRRLPWRRADAAPRFHRGLTAWTTALRRGGVLTIELDVSPGRTAPWSSPSSVALGAPRDRATCRGLRCPPRASHLLSASPVQPHASPSATVFSIGATVIFRSHAFLNQEHIVRHPDGQILDLGSDGRGGTAGRRCAGGPRETCRREAGLTRR